MRIAWLEMFTVLGVMAAAPARAAAPGDACEAVPAPCDYAAGGASCKDPEPSETIFPLELESMRKVEASATRCRGAWQACRKDLEPDLADLHDVDAEIADVEARSNALPDAAAAACARTRPSLARSALGDVASWCAVSRDECLGAVRDAKRMLDGMPAWAECVERMESRRGIGRRARRAAHGLRGARGRGGRAGRARRPGRARARAGGPAAGMPAAPPAPAPSATPTASARPESRPEARAPAAVAPVTRNGEALPTVVYASPTVVRPAPTAVYDAPAPAPTADEPRIASQDAGPVESAVATVGQRPAPPSERRKGEVTLSVAPFSGTMTIRDPVTKRDYSPLSASVAVGLDVVLGLTPGLDLQIGIGGRGTLASTALQQAASVSLDNLDTESGSAIVVDLEPELSLLSEHVGFGLIGDFRWDSVGVTSATTGLASSHSHGGAAGARLMLGFGLLERDLRFAGILDYLCVGDADGQWRASLRAELGGLLLTASYEQYFQLGAADDGHVVDHMQLTLGFRMPF
ncbi:MAG: hypothetical protein U1F43_22390 [Myxococcota bacterium]